MNDLHIAFRMLRRSPGFTAVALLTLGLGIGANTALFSVFKAVVLEPFPYPDAHRLVHVWRTSVGYRWQSPLSAPDFFDFRDGNTTFAEMGGRLMQDSMAHLPSGVLMPVTKKSKSPSGIDSVRLFLKT